jgi:tetratricopeptide (TPR) repeat protein
MAEEPETTDAQPAGNAMATSMALGAAAQNERVAAKAETFLEEQTAVLRLQKEQMQEEADIHRWSLRIRHFSDVMKVAFELSVAFIVLALAVGIGAAIWNAASDKGLAIEAFSVPPDLAARGLTGEVVATKLLDRLSALQSQTTSNRAPSSYANNWGNDIKVQIPDTGVSIGELNRYLRNWLGHETHISGEVYRIDSDIAVTARAGSDTSPTFQGKEADLDKLIQRAAEAVYRSTQPYRYAVYLDAHNRAAEAKAIYEQLLVSGSREDRAWAYIGLDNQLVTNGDFVGGTEDLRRTIAIDPQSLLAYENMANNEGTLQHDEQSLIAARQAVTIGEAGGDSSMDPENLPVRVLQDKGNVAGALGDFGTQIAFDREIEQMPDRSSLENAYESDIQACAALHDGGCVQMARESLRPTRDAVLMLGRAATLQFANMLLEHWQTVRNEADALLPELAKLGRPGKVFLQYTEYPFLAFTDGNLGDFKGAHSMIDKTPADCVTCLRLRGRIDALQHRWADAGYWFARAVNAAPSVPFGETDWGQMLLMKGDADGAIAKFAQAHAKGPHYADPLEMWGEALMLKNQSDLAVTKFAEADRYAPNWGRLHLKWGEALIYAGQPEAAKKQFGRAAELDISAKDRAELKRF